MHGILDSLPFGTAHSVTLLEHCVQRGVATHVVPSQRQGILTNHRVDIRAAVALQVQSAQGVAGINGLEPTRINTCGVVEYLFEGVCVTVVDGVVKMHVVGGIYLQVQGPDAVAGKRTLGGDKRGELVLVITCDGISTRLEPVVAALPFWSAAALPTGVAHGVAVVQVVSWQESQVE